MFNSGLLVNNLGLSGVPFQLHPIYLDLSVHFWQLTSFQLLIGELAWLFQVNKFNGSNKFFFLLTLLF